MTIEFNCPNCNAVIAFTDKYAGKKAHCTSCQQKFIIPSKSFEKAKKIKPPREIGEPIPGFYHAVFIDSWKMFVHPKNAAGLLFILIFVVFKFFAAYLDISLHIQGQWLAFDFYIPLGWASRGAAWGGLFWFYSEMIYWTGFDQDEFPTVTIGGLYGFIWIIVKSVYVIFVLLLVVGWPYFLTYLILKYLHVDLPIVLYPLMFGGLFLLPIGILTVAVGKDLTMLRPDYLLVPIRRAFMPYMVTAALLGGAVISQIFTSPYKNQSPKEVAIDLSLNVLVQAFVLIAMRSIGLFYRHYSCHLPW
ncbi:MAG: hypothetical protein JXM79_01505 [Sedimentisphaerales bacterium]|nr:hypothetical protein [Sedimentisphaerales bacterium]